MPNESAASEPQEIRRYLLRQLTEEESSRVERRYFSDAEFLQQVEDEADLIAEAYVANRLAEVERAALASEADSPMWRDRLRAERALHAVLTSPVAAEGKESGRRPALARARRRWWNVGTSPLAAAAGLLLTVMGWAGYARERSARGELAAERDAIAAQLGVARRAADSAIALEQSRSADLERQVASATTVRFTAGFAAGRGDSYTIPRSATFVEIELDTEQPVEDRPWRVRVMDPGRQRTAWSETSAASTAKARSAHPIIRIPTAILTDREYHAVLEVDRGSGFATEAEYSLTFAPR